MEIKKTRKRRTDRNHAIYMIERKNSDDFYIGVTGKGAGVSLARSVEIRLIKHIRRANTENKDWTLCKQIRKYGGDAFTISVLEIVRGKKEAHQRERELIRKFKPTLNTDIREKTQ